MNEVLGFTDKVRLLPVVVARLTCTVVELGVYSLGKRGPELSSVPVLRATVWTAAADEVANDALGKQFLAHSERVWLFGMALARVKRVTVDPELFYVAAMLHDVGLRKPLPDRCFTAAGVEAVRATAPRGTADDDIRQVERAIFEHVAIRRPKALLSRCLQAGSLLDVAGTGITKLGPEFTRDVCKHRAGFPEECRTAWRAESQRFPDGRAAYARCPGGLLIGTRLNRLPH